MTDLTVAAVHYSHADRAADAAAAGSVYGALQNDVHLAETAETPLAGAPVPLLAASADASYSLLPPPAAAVAGASWPSASASWLSWQLFWQLPAPPGPAAAQWLSASPAWLCLLGPVAEQQTGNTVDSDITNAENIRLTSESEGAHTATCDATRHRQVTQCSLMLLNNCVVHAATHTDICIHNLIGQHGIRVVEHALAMMIRATTDVPELCVRTTDQHPRVSYRLMHICHWAVPKGSANQRPVQDILTGTLVKPTAAISVTVMHVIMHTCQGKKASICWRWPWRIGLSCVKKAFMSALR